MASYAANVDSCRRLSARCAGRWNCYRSVGVFLCSAAMASSPPTSTPVNGSPRVARDAGTAIVAAACFYVLPLWRLTPPTSTPVDGSPRFARDVGAAIVAAACFFARPLWRRKTPTSTGVDGSPPTAGRFAVGSVGS